jgi:hypothetical protein
VQPLGSVTKGVRPAALLAFVALFGDIWLGDFVRVEQCQLFFVAGWFGSGARLWWYIHCVPPFVRYSLV